MLLVLGTALLPWSLIQGRGLLVPECDPLSVGERGPLPGLGHPPPTPG